jgi:hypothetical protein
MGRPSFVANFFTGERGSAMSKEDRAIAESQRSAGDLNCDLIERLSAALAAAN